MANLYCIDIGLPRRTNMWSTTSAAMVVVADTPEEATEYVRQNCPELLRNAVVLRVYRVLHVGIDWTSGEVDFKEPE
jgi:hypothetical protein